MTFKREYLALPKPIAAQYATPSGVVCVQVIVPDGLPHLALLQGLMATLTDASAWQGDDADRAALAAIWQNAYTITDWEECEEGMDGYANRVTLWHRFANVYVGSAIVQVINTGTIFNGYAHATTPANGDSSYQNCWLTPGDYTIKMLCLKTTSAGKIFAFVANETTLYQETVFNDVDLYASPAVNNQLVTGTFTITEPTDRFYVQCVSKNALSSGYDLPLICFDIVKDLP